MTADRRIGRHAVVIGASMAGLLTARVLGEAYERVTIVDRDALPVVGQGRRGVPQGCHAHVLLASGQRSIEELIPGITRELRVAGALSCEVLREVRLVLGGHQLSREARGADVLLASRPLVEGHVRQRVLALPELTVRSRCRVLGLLVSRDRGRVTGVRVAVDGGDASEEHVDADLVVAASGGSGLLPRWLERLGYGRPAEDRLQVDLTYVSRRLRLRSDVLDAKLVLIGARPGVPRGLALIAQERGEWILTASGYGALHRPPTEPDDYLKFVAGVAPPDVTAAVQTAEYLDGPVTHAYPANLRRRYERMTEFPRGLLVVGDAFARFNPLYGQGMSVAALEAVRLGDCLRRGEERLAERFFRAACSVINPAWDMAVGSDLALPEVPGHRPLPLRMSNVYAERVLRAAEHDAIVAGVFSEVSDLLAPPGRLMAPDVLWRVLRGNLIRARPPAAAERDGCGGADVPARETQGR